MKAALCAGMAILIPALFVLAMYFSLPHAGECETDTECAALCPSDETECDGGPQD
jgi:hypothetical protein